MPRTRSLAWSELKVGIITVVAVILAATMIFLLSGEGGFFWQRYSIKAAFDNIAGLKEGAPVRVAGVEVGSVSDVSFAGDRVEVTLELREENRARVTTESRASLGSVSLLGEAAVDITPSSRGATIPEWGYITTTPPAASITEATAKVTVGLEEATAVIKDLRAGRGTVGQLFTNDSVYRELERFISSAEQVTAQINSGKGTLGRLTTDPALYDDLRASTKTLNEVIARIRSGEGSLGKLLNDPAVANSLTATTENLEGITGRLNRGEGTAGKLITETQLYDRVNGVVDRLDTLTARLSAGEGTAGQLLQDKRLYENMTQAVAEMRELFAQIRKDPRKYLNVKVSIF